MKDNLRAFCADTQAQDMVEYSLIVAVVVLAAVVAMPVLGGTVSNVFSKVTSYLSGSLA